MRFRDHCWPKASYLLQERLEWSRKRLEVFLFLDRLFRLIFLVIDTWHPCSDRGKDVRLYGCGRCLDGKRIRIKPSGDLGGSLEGSSYGLSWSSFSWHRVDPGWVGAGHVLDWVAFSIDWVLISPKSLISTAQISFIKVLINVNFWGDYGMLDTRGKLWCFQLDYCVQ